MCAFVTRIADVIALVESWSFKVDRHSRERPVNASLTSLRMTQCHGSFVPYEYFHVVISSNAAMSSLFP